MEQASRPFTCNNKLVKNMASIMKKKLKKRGKNRMLKKINIAKLKTLKKYKIIKISY